MSYLAAFACTVATQSNHSLLQVRPIPSLATYAAVPYASCWIAISIIFAVFVACWTVGFGALMTPKMSGQVSPRDILPPSNRFKMLWVYAGAISTEMINFQSGRNRTIRPLVCDSMGKSGFTFEPKAAISSIDLAGVPNPARFRFDNLGPKSYLRIYWFASHQSTLTQGET